MHLYKWKGYESIKTRNLKIVPFKIIFNTQFLYIQTKSL
jgi:hypothetical protein